KTLLRSTVSSEGPNNAILGPGEEILSIRSQDSYSHRAIKDEILKFYFTQSGTSFAAPMVTATASLMLAKNPNLSATDIADILMGTATDMDDPGWDGLTGAGLLNATAALKAAKERFLTVQINDFRLNYDGRDRFASVDVLATVRGEFKEFTVSVGKGKRAKRFEKVAGPFTDPAEYQLITRLSEDVLRGSDEWQVRITVLDLNGAEHIAETLLEYKRKQ
ncbi:MAG: S8 family serine peptidase, partial [Candidatus Omnitrophica bacterium]|nr:S8 family serine peptidase [Candidatus Omnitrophota bacterium]